MNEFDMLQWWLQKNVKNLITKAIKLDKHDEDIESLILALLDGEHCYQLSPVGTYLFSVYKNNFIPHIIKSAKSIDESEIMARDLDNAIKEKIFQQIYKYK